MGKGVAMFHTKQNKVKQNKIAVCVKGRCNVSRGT